MMKIAIDLRMWVSGGIGSYIKELLPFFLKENKCLLICYPEDLENINGYLKNENQDNIRTVSCSIKAFSLKEMLNFPRNILNEINSCDCFFSPYCNVPSGIKIPFYSTIHDVVFLDVKGLSSTAGTLARKIFYKRALNKSKAVFTVSEFSKKRIQFHLGNKTPLHVIYNSAPEYLKTDSEKIEKDNSILFVGNIKKHKGLHTLLDAFSLVIKDIPEAKLVIVGNADNFRSKDESIKEKFDSMPQDCFEFTGRISDDKLRNYYKKARMLVQPSLYEGFGMPPLEALTCGTNAVISDIEVFKEIYRDFPVEFFQCQNHEDLYSKIKSTWNKPSPDKIPDIYSYENSWHKIQSVISVTK